MTNTMTTFDSIAAIHLAISILDENDETQCDIICDSIMQLPDLSQNNADKLLSAAESRDPHFAFHAAHIRDTIRDNFDLIIP